MPDQFDAYVLKRKRSIRLAEHLQRMHSRLYELNDTQLRIGNNNGFYRNPDVSINYLNLNHPALAQDPAFQKLKSLYDSLKNAGHLDSTWLLIKPLNELATQMANRTLTQEDYRDILDERLNCMDEAKGEIRRVKELEEAKSASRRNQSARELSTAFNDF